jgi:hypothetical protein
LSDHDRWIECRDTGSLIMEFNDGVASFYQVVSYSLL